MEKVEMMKIKIKEEWREWRVARIMKSNADDEKWRWRRVVKMMKNEDEEVWTFWKVKMLKYENYRIETKKWEDDEEYWK